MVWMIIEFFAGLCLMATIVHLIPQKQITASPFGIIYSSLFYLITPIFSLLLLDFPWNDTLFQISAFHILINYFLLLLLQSIFVLLTPRAEFGIYLTLILSGFMGIANLEVITFRFYPIAPVDLLSLRTAAAVADGYEIFFSRKIFFTILFALLFMTLVGIHKDLWNSLAKKTSSIRIYLARVLLALCTFLTLFTWVSKIDFYDTYEVKNYEWDPAKTYKECGFALSFTAQLHEAIPSKPEGYTKTKAQEIINDGKNAFDASYPDYTASTSEAPIIITIMNESFTDYSMIGDFSANENYLSFFHSLQKDAGTLEYGYCYTSTFGGGTYKSEFECLTGNSMANISGTLPYMMFDFFSMDSVVNGYNEAGFTTVASHPSFPTNWRRNTVYKGMGFSDFLHLSDYSPDLSLQDSRGYMSDAANYDRLLEEIKNHDEPLFLFNVTIQNHGGYEEKDLGDIAVDVDSKYNQYEDLRIFSGLMEKSDAALESFIQELKKINRPVILCFYGDHQPSLNQDFLEDLLSSEKNKSLSAAELEQKRYITPYVIWTNQKSPSNSFATPVSTDGNYNIITPTYIGAMAKYYMGCTLSDYEKYLIALRSKLPVLNTSGCYTIESGFVSSSEYDTITDENLTELLKDYSYVEYQRIYD